MRELTDGGPAMTDEGAEEPWVTPSSVKLVPSIYLSVPCLFLEKVSYLVCLRVQF